MTCVDMMYRMVTLEQAERQAHARHSHLAHQAPPARAPRQHHVRMALGSALIRVGTRLAPHTAPVGGEQ